MSLQERHENALIMTESEWDVVFLQEFVDTMH